ncbi:MAG TPA: ZIP family metal transporter, partial [bacterium]|nr:ZIP family metal transporter [bacterium]
MPHLSLEHYFTHPIYLMFASIAALFLGPLINAMFRGQRFVRDTIEGFTLVMIILLVAMYILPHTVHDVGFWAVVMLLIGMFLPSVFEKTYVRLASHVHYATIFVVMLGFATHAFLDGVALVTPSSICSIDAEHSVSMLPIAVLLHRLPEGLAIWTLIRPWYGNRRAILMLLISAISTVAGVTSGSLLISHIPHEPFGFFEALIAGLLLHILFHRHDPYEPSGCHDCETPKFDFKWGTGVGAILGFVLILAIQSSQHADHAHGSKAMIFWNLAFSSA